MSILGRLLAGSKGEESAQARERADGLIARGQGEEDAGDFAAAEATFREALLLAPRYPRVHLNLGNALHKQGRLEESAASHRAAIAIDAAYAGGHYNLGMVLIQMHAFVEAKRHLERSLAIEPGLADAAVNIAHACEESGDLAGTRRALERALAIAPGHVGALTNLGSVLAALGDFNGAERALHAALAADPNASLALSGVARLEVQRGRAEQADAPFRAALRADPHDSSIWSAFLFSLNLRDDVDAVTVAREHFAFGEAMEPSVAARPVARARGKRLRVGFVSGDLARHPVGLFLRPVLVHRDRDAFEMYCYSSGHVQDEVTANLRAAADGWRSIAGRGDGWVEKLVRDDAIDVLVDLSGHTAGNRLGVFARRPAPVQATWLGYLNTTGLRAMDYRICDSHTDPEGATEKLHSESLLRLPASQWCYAPYYDVPPLAPAARGDRPVTFGSFNQLMKIGDACLDLWSAVLERVPGSRLRMYGVPAGVTLQDVASRLEKRGIAGTRVELHGRTAILDYFAAIADVDIAFDAMPYNGATTTLDTLWMGTPLVALAGARGISRGSYSIARTAGLDELIAASAEEYVEANVRLAGDVAARAALRASLRPRLEASPLMDGPAFARALEDAFRRIVEVPR